MILGIVFSRDRPLQLEAALASFARQAVDAEAVGLVVLLKASSERYRAQYDEVRHEFPHHRFVHEQDFRRQVLDLLQSPRGVGNGHRGASIWRRLPGGQEWGVGVDHLNTQFVLFIVDDTLFIRPFELGAAVETLKSNPDALGFSFRLGRNTAFSYVQARPQILPDFQTTTPGILRFKWKRADGDFAYPLEVSSSLYRLDTIDGLSRRLAFGDPNTLESQMGLRARVFARKMPYLLCPDQSVAFSAPMNRVQEVFQNRAGVDATLSTERLADIFDRGQRIDVVALDGFVPTACHQEVELAFEPRPR